MLAVPNIDIREPIEVAGLALLSADDDRVQTLARRHRRFGMYLRRFTTEFGDRVTPSILLKRSDSPQSFRSVEALAGFRDAIAMSVIPYSWAHVLRYENNQNIRYANWFSFFPWMVDAKYNGLIMQSMAQLGWHEVRKLKGQTTSGLSHMTLEHNMIDAPLLNALLSRWQARYTTDTPTWKDTALFRSLNMALSAAMLPGNVEVTIYDIGRSVALWVSAFEILAHPEEADVGYLQVFNMLDAITWNLTDCKEQRYEPYRYKLGQPLRTLPVWIYGELNRARNDFLHGNPIDASRLIVAPGKRPLHLYAGPLFRMALAAFIDLKHIPRLKRDDETEYEAYLSDQFMFGRFQRDIEVALSTILLTVEERRESKKRPRTLRPGTA
jgi:hypothetical protein